MTAAGEKIAAAIRRGGPIRFSQFMETALYDAECGYYMGAKEVFGRAGDYYTSGQLQPVFGRLVAAALGRRKQEQGEPWRVVEWGAGRGEMAEYLEGLGYSAIDVGRDEAPASFEGVAFSNEWFDALPVDAARRVDGVWSLMRVGMADEKFGWSQGERLEGEWLEYAGRAGANIEQDEAWIELPVRVKEALGGIEERLERGSIVAVDYGYTERELRRFAAGTLMSYRRHQASGEVLENPGEQDITAHVPFTYLMESAAGSGWRDGRMRTLARWLMEECGESGLERAIEAEGEAARLKLRLQLKTILFGMGESFRVAEWEKGG
jgi:SAM-dependent MidA family methyltransferase